MANGGANISRGMGRGAAQVYDTSGPVNMYARLMYQQQLRRAAETKALTDELGKVTPEGLRQPDVKGFLDQYGRWRDKSIEANAERNPTRKALLSQEAEKEKLATILYKDDSKNELINERKRQEFLINPENRNRYSKEIMAKIINSKNLSKDDIEYVRDMNKFEIKPDLTKIRKLLDDTDANLMKYTKPTRVQEEGERLGVKGLYESDVTTLSPAEQATAYSVLFDTDEGEFKAFLRGLSPDFVNLTEKQLKVAGIPILVQERPKSTYSDKKFVEPDNWREKQLANDRLIRARKSEGDAEEESTYRQQIVRGIMNNDKGSIDEMRAYLPSGSTVQYITSDKLEKGIQKVKGKIVFNKNESKGGYNFIRVNIPAVSDGEGTIKKPGIVEDISLSLGDPKNRLNAILSEYIGEGVSPSKFNIRGGKPRGEQIDIKGQEKTTKPASTVNEYTGITTVKDAKENSFQIGVKDGKWYTIKTGKIYQ